MSSKVPICGVKVLISDPFYRYKMNDVQIQQSKGKYVFSNIDAICADLNRPPAMILKYLKSYFGASIEHKNGSATTSAQLTHENLKHAIGMFIDEFVLCKKCMNPETIIESEKKKQLMTCKACGHVFNL